MEKNLILAYDFPPYVSVGGLRPYSWFKHLEELGTGIRKVFKYSTLYTGKDPVFNENDLFEVIVPVTENITKEKENTTKETKNTTKEKENITKEKESLILSLLAKDARLTAKDLAHHIGLSSDGVRYYLKKLKATGKLERKVSPVP